MAVSEPPDQETHPEIPEPEMALPRWPSIAEMNPAHLFGEADETTAYQKE